MSTGMPAIVNGATDWRKYKAPQITGGSQTEASTSTHVGDPVSDGRFAPDDRDTHGSQVGPHQGDNDESKESDVPFTFGLYRNEPYARQTTDPIRRLANGKHDDSSGHRPTQATTQVTTRSGHAEATGSERSGSGTTSVAGKKLSYRPDMDFRPTPSP